MRLICYSIFLGSLLCTPAPANAGDRTGNGGDAELAEIISIHSEILVHLNSRRETNRYLFDIDLDQAIPAIQKTVVECGKNLILNGNVVDAINYPWENPPRVTYDCERWTTLTQRKRIRLALHELTYIAGYDDRDYKTSQLLFEDFEARSNERIEGNNELLDAIYEGCDLRRFTQANGNLNYLNPESGVSVFMTAAVFGCEKIQDYLIDEQINPGHCPSIKGPCINLLYLSELRKYTRNKNTLEETLKRIKRIHALQRNDSTRINTCLLREHNRDFYFPTVFLKNQDCEDMELVTVLRQNLVYRKDPYEWGGDFANLHKETSLNVPSEIFELFK